MEKIIHQKKIVALVIKTISEGSVPLTDPHEPLQLVTLKHGKGKYLKAHLHTPKRRQTDKLQECLIVKKGKIAVDVYTENKLFLKRKILNNGDVLTVMNGGYGIKILSDSELIEVKNGPFVEDKELI